MAATGNLPEHFPGIGAVEYSNKLESRPYYSNLEVRTRFEIYKFAEDYDVRGSLLDLIEQADPSFKQLPEFLELGCADVKDIIDQRRDREYSGHFTGIDTNADFFAVGQRIMKRDGVDGVDLFPGLAEDLSRFEDNSFDVVEAWYMLYETDIDKALDEIQRVLKPGGLFLLTTHSEGNIPLHRRIERLMSIYSHSDYTEGTYRPPIVRSKLFSESKARPIMAQRGFGLLHDLPVLRKIVIPSDQRHVYRESLSTRKDEFKERDGKVPSLDDWHKLMKVVDEYIESEIKANGVIVDYMDRWGAIYQKPPFNPELADKLRIQAIANYMDQLLRRSIQSV